MNNNTKIIFIGTSDFAVPILERLIANRLSPIAVVTAPDKPVGRKQIITPPPVKSYIIKHETWNIPILQPEKLDSSFKFQVSSFKPDLIVVAAYGQIIPKEILDIPRYGCLNVHASLLPKYRGPSPIQHAILNGEKETGVTIILMDEKVDQGPILAQRELEFSIFNFQFSKLNEELARLSAELLVETIPKWIGGEIKPVAQDETKASYTKILRKEDGHINWTKPAEYIERQIRAFEPWPGTFASFKIKNQKLKIKNTNQKSKILKILNADILFIQTKKQAGEVFLTEDKKLAVACGPVRRSLGEGGKNALILEEVQPEGKRKMTAREFLNGYPWIIGTILL